MPVKDIGTIRSLLTLVGGMVGHAAAPFREADGSRAPVK